MGVGLELGLRGLLQLSNRPGASKAKVEAYADAYMAGSLRRGRIFGIGTPCECASKKAAVTGGTEVAGVDGRLKITIALDNIRWGDGARGVDFTLHVSGGLKVTIAGTTLLALSISEQGAVTDIVDLDKLPNPFDSL